MQTNLRGLNIKYAFCNIGYLFLIVGTMGYAYNYLSQCGFSDGVAGTVMAVTNLLGAIGGPVVGDIIDHNRTVSQKTFIQASSIIIIAASVLSLKSYELKSMDNFTSELKSIDNSALAL